MNILSSTKLKEVILCELNQIEVFSKYTEIPISEITACLNNSNRKTNNVLRGDPHPSTGFKWKIDKSLSEYKIHMHDFGDSYWRGDIFDIVGKVLHLNSNNNIEFVQICENIISNGDDLAPIDYTIHTKLKSKSNKTLTEFGLEFRNFTDNDLRYWKQSNLTQDDLIKANVFAVQCYWNTETLNINYNYRNNKDVCYAYFLDQIGIALIWKLYFVNRGRDGDKRARFITNNIYPLEAMHELEKADALLITKSRGDTLASRSILTILQRYASFLSTGGYKVCVTNLTTETSRLTKLLVAELRKDYSLILLNTDFDPEGIRSAKYHLKHYGIRPLFLTNGKGGTKDYGAKDVRDYIRNFGVDKTLTLFNTTIHNIEEELREIDHMTLF